MNLDDVQQVAGYWRQPASSPRCGVADVNGDAVIDVENIMLAVREISYLSEPDQEKPFRSVRKSSVLCVNLSGDGLRA